VTVPRYTAVESVVHVARDDVPPARRRRLEEFHHAGEVDAVVEQLGRAGPEGVDSDSILAVIKGWVGCW